MIAFTCSECGKRLEVKAEHAGKKVKCPACGAVATVPQKSSASAEGGEQIHGDRASLDDLAAAVNQIFRNWLVALQEQRFWAVGLLLLSIFILGVLVYLTVTSPDEIDRVRPLENTLPKLRQENKALDDTVRKKEADIKRLITANAELNEEIQSLSDENARFKREVERLEQTMRHFEVYSLMRCFPQAVPFKHGVWLKLGQSGIVKRVQFAENEARAFYVNDTTQRVKPDVTIWVLNVDGVVVQKLTDSWLIDSMHPGGTYQQEWTFSPKMPENLVFSKWSRIAWDPRPAYVIAVGSKSACDDLLNRTRAEIKRLNKR